ncbi:MAG: hypothetical protein Q8O37_11435 [Sulfuricellaceae bacterium]|nr:hypothetical protein [Sulfuricellaceae bacterium]
MDKIFQIFKPGSHTAMNNDKHEFSEAALSLTASTYPHSKGLAPLTLGHPADNQPELGIVKKLIYKNRCLYAVADVSDRLISLVREGRYKNLSAKFWPPNHPLNPVPGVFSLVHVGFLGAHPPAVRGMEKLAFSESTGDGGACFAVACELGNCAQPGTASGFVLPRGFSVDPASALVYERAKALQQGAHSLAFCDMARIASGIF